LHQYIPIVELAVVIETYKLARILSIVRITDCLQARLTVT
jgi:hypothetical protein